MTPAAVEKIRQAKPAGKADCIRIGQDPPGVGPFSYRMEFDDKRDAEEDFVDESCGITVIVAKQLRVYLQGTTLDYVVTRPGGPAGFVFENPNEKSG